ncbi:hypothetical protein KR084_010438, partial [Drosophila pseudotakahashii]
MSGVQLIVTPTTLSFQAPFVHSQKRLITLLNPSDKAVIYRICISNDAVYTADPSFGTVEAFETTELTVTLSPVKEDLPDCSIVVRSISKDNEKKTEWNAMEVKIELDPKKTPRQGDETLTTRLQPQDLAEILKKHYNPVCAECGQK